MSILDSWTTCLEMIVDRGFTLDKKYSTLDKENQWILCSEDQIVWVVGQRVDTRFAATPETLNSLIIRSH